MVETKDEQIARLRTALQHAASVFEAYQFHHAAKGDEEKAARNEKHAQVCLDALSEPDATADTDKHRGQFYVSPAGRWGLLLGQGRAVEFELNGVLKPRDSNVDDVQRTVFAPDHSRHIARKILDLLSIEGIMVEGPKMADHNRRLVAVLKQVRKHSGLDAEIDAEIDAVLGASKDGAG